MTIPNTAESDNGAICVICLESDGLVKESSGLMPMVGCACIYQVHAECLEAWIEASAGPKCVLCGEIPEGVPLVAREEGELNQARYGEIITYRLCLKAVCYAIIAFLILSLVLNHSRNS